MSAARPVKVTPAGSWQLAYAGKLAGPGEEITVPAELAERWARAGLSAEA